MKKIYFALLLALLSTAAISADPTLRFTSVPYSFQLSKPTSISFAAQADFCTIQIKCTTDDGEVSESYRSIGAQAPSVFLWVTTENKINTVHWSTKNADSCIAQNGWTPSTALATEGSFVAPPVTVPTNYGMSCVGKWGLGGGNVTVQP